MPRADITSEYRSDHGQSKFPRLKLQAFEKARIVVVSKPIVEYIHRLEAPNIVNMAPTYKKVTDGDGAEKFVVETRWVSSPICMGIYEVLRERGVDDKTCQACAQARERPDIFRPPQPKFAANILRYALRPGGGWNDIMNPYGVAVLVWVFGGKVMDKLIDIRQMGSAYEDIRGVDLLIECDKEVKFQKPYSNGEFLPSAPAVWMSNDATRKYTITCLEQNGASDEELTASLGKRVKEDWLADDLSRVIQRWDVVRAYESRQGGAPMIGPGFGAETLQQGMNAVAQQFGQPSAAAPTGNYGAGINMGLLGPAATAPSQHSALTQAAGLDVQRLQQEQMARLQAAGTPVPQPPAPSVPETPQWQPSGTEGDMFAPPAGPDVSGLADLPAPPAQQPPSGLEGLGEFVHGSTHNPGSMPSDAPLTPPGAQAAAASTPPGGAKYTFEELARLGKQ